ncbi:MAG: T9SS type A sorting domain-containing protein, partial [Bacteroidales bacterium]|nr:T9SS type A sorting domain-containing protein [Bacteroidales bacterium]
TVFVREISYGENLTIFPNPVESSAVIEYTLLHNSHVTLKIYDLSGQVVVTLANEFQQSGAQKVVFNGTGLMPGIYFCVLKTSEWIQTMKMIKI